MTRTADPPVSFRFTRPETPVAVPLTQAAQTAQAVAEWFTAASRDLPWRTPGVGTARNPYHALVAETMLQQTQVSRVIERFSAFIERFPSVRSLAAAGEDDVLALWSGLGYYRRAKNLHAAAKMIVAEFGGVVPRDVDELVKLPGVGRYTAGAIASIAYNQSAPIVDGNVARVLLRLHARDVAGDDKAVQPWLWEQAAELVAPATCAAAGVSPGKVNEGLMELGATVCLPGPAEPRCDACPLASLCRARRDGVQDRIPRPKTSATRKDVYCLSVVVERAGDGAILVEQRPDHGPATGMWAGLWQAPTFEHPTTPPSLAAAARDLGVPGSPRTLTKSDEFEFFATHRRVLFRVVRTTVPPEFVPTRGKFVSRAMIRELALSNPQRRILLGERV